MKSTKSTACTAAGALLALASMSIQVHAQNHKLEFIEFSDTLLTATLDGSPVGTVKTVGPDHWNGALTLLAVPLSKITFNHSSGKSPARDRCK